MPWPRGRQHSVRGSAWPPRQWSTIRSTTVHAEKPVWTQCRGPKTANICHVCASCRQEQLIGSSAAALGCSLPSGCTHCLGTWLFLSIPKRHGHDHVTMPSAHCGVKFTVMPSHVPWVENDREHVRQPAWVRTSTQWVTGASLHGPADAEVHKADHAGPRLAQHRCIAIRLEQSPRNHHACQNAAST